MLGENLPQWVTDLFLRYILVQNLVWWKKIAPLIILSYLKSSAKGENKDMGLWDKEGLTYFLSR